VTAVDDFTERLARVRRRFAAALDGKIADSFAALEKMSGSGGEAIEIVITAHRRLHELCGIAPTLGFTAIGNAARSGETVMREAARAKRALTPAELTALKSELEALRTAASGDLQTYSNRG
jgi:HPt (histidine-containing phosphotransfer) domain-containing protein